MRIKAKIIKIYGKIIKYKMPVLRPLAILEPPFLLDSATARHMEHCANAKSINSTKIVIKISREEFIALLSHSYL